MANIVDQKYWDQSYINYQYMKTSQHDPIKKYITNFFKDKHTTHNSIIEIGCFPGRYLTVFGDLGYQLNGIDITPRIEKDFKFFLEKEKYKIGDIICDLFPSTKLKKYDIVSSFGFIEHFTDYEDIIHEHAKIVKPNGFLMITTPNFAHGIQKYFHKTFDNKNFKRHVIESMNPNIWEEILKNQGFDIIDKGYIGGFDIRWDLEERNILKKIFLFGISLFKNIINKISSIFSKGLYSLPNHRFYSPYCFIVARKNQGK